MTKRRILLGLTTAFVSMALFAGTANAEKIWAITGNHPDDTGTGGFGAFTVQNLIWFQHTTPGTVVTVGPISGVIAGHTLRSIDFRPANGALYALSTSANGAQGQIYTVNLSTAALTTVGSPFALGTGMTTNTDPRAEMEFDPQGDFIRVLTADFGGENNNFRVSTAGVMLGTDSNLAYALGDPNAPFVDVTVVAAAYSNNVAGASSTTLYVWDQKDDTLARVGDVGGSPQSANTGQMHTVQTPAFPGITFDPSTVGMDISPSTGTNFVTYFSRAPLTSTTTLATRDLTTGVVTPIANFAAGVYPTDISVQRATTAASVSVSGLVLSAANRGLVGATVTIQDASSGASQTVITKRGGQFIFDGVESGRPYILSVRSRLHVYDSQVVVVNNDSVSGVTFRPAGNTRPGRN